MTENRIQSASTETGKAKLADSDQYVAKLVDDSVNARFLQQGKILEDKKGEKNSNTKEKSRELTKDDWTIDVNLAVNKSSALGYPAQEKLESLLALAPLTEKKPVTIVVQQITNRPEHSSAVGPAHNEYYRKRYLIRNGNWSVGNPILSQGFADDAASLLDSSIKNFPARNTAYFMFCDGSGNLAVSGDTGICGLTQFSHKLQKVLNSNEQGKLELFDFDACLMAQDGVLNQSQPFAKHLIASSETIDAIKSPSGLVLGQNFKAYTEYLLNNSKIDGDQFGHTIIELTKNGVNDGSGSSHSFPRSCTPVLAHFNLGKPYEYFRARFNSFGKSLQEAINNPQNRERIEAIIVDTPRLPACEEGMPLHDLKCFAQSIEESVNHGLLIDNNGQIKQSTEQLLNAQKELVESYRGIDPNQFETNSYKCPPYYKLGGLNVFLPSRNIHSMESTFVPAIGKIEGMKAQLTGSVEQKNNDIEHLNDIQDELSKLKQGQFLCEQTQKLLNQAKVARSDKELAAAESDFLLFTRKSLNSVTQQEIDRIVRLETSQNSQWDRFINKLW